jgi:hypothetical protein
MNVQKTQTLSFVKAPLKPGGKTSAYNNLCRAIV